MAHLRMKILIYSVLVFLFSFPVQAEMFSETCGTNTCVTKMLFKKYGELPRGMGLSYNGAVIQLFTNEITAKWSVVQRQPSGKACITIFGDGWIVTTPIPAEALN